MLALAGSLLLPLVSVAAVPGTTYTTPYTTTTAPVTIAEHTAVVETVSGGETSLRGMTSGQARSLSGQYRSLVAPKTTKGLGGRTLSAAEKAKFDSFAARAKAQGLVENPHRTGSWGKMVNGKFKEVTRIDVGEVGKAGWRGKTHIHVEGQKGHLDPTTAIPGE
jgi:hypothetical protein